MSQLRARVEGPRGVRLAAAGAVCAAGTLVVALLLLRSGARSERVATLYGETGSFGRLGDAHRLSGGQSFTAEAVAGWRFLPGEAAYFTVVAPDGSVFMGNEPQTDNQTQPTARQMAISVFTPATDRFRTIVIPTSTGVTHVTGPWPSATLRVGGADISDLAVSNDDGASRIAFLSAMPYEGWNLAEDGVYPTLGYLSNRSGAWSVDRSASVSALTVARSATGVTGEPCDEETSAEGGAFADCRLPTEMSVLPGSRDLIVTQYAGNDADSTSGGLMALRSDGRVLGTYAYPRIVGAGGQVLNVHPREVDADPASSGERERFVVVFDTSTVPQAGAPARSGPFAMQEFGFRARSGSIAPLSAPVLTGDRAPDGTPLGFETAAYDRRGTLWAAQSENGTLTGGPMAVYRRQSDGGTLDRPGCAVSPGWSGAGWGTTCRPDTEVKRTASLGIVRSLNDDSRTGTMLITTLPGELLAVRMTDGDAVVASEKLINLDLDDLADRQTHQVGLRKGSIDPVTDTLYLPVQQLQSPTRCPVYPCVPARLDQWLYAIHLGAWLGGATTS